MQAKEDLWRQRPVHAHGHLPGKTLVSKTFIKFDQFLSDIEEYKDDIDPQQEADRSNDFNDALGTEGIAFSDLVEIFGNDPAFARFLKRHTPAHIQEKNHLDPEMMWNSSRSCFDKNLALKRMEIIDTILSPFTIKDISGKTTHLESYDLIPKMKTAGASSPNPS
jgi:hypothetical protein